MGSALDHEQAFTREVLTIPNHGVWSSTRHGNELSLRLSGAVVQGIISK
jgi:hypothetical protein